MANTTNFNWETPDDTDLVKDGAAAIRTLGSAIDTSLVDLKGGTTDQVLAKNSNTDMDFKWVTSDDANAIQNAIVDAKGDIVAASAADTPARLAVGTDNQRLVAASGETTGLKYVSDTQNTVIDAAGDLLYGTAGDTLGRLAIGTAGQVLKVNSGATAPEWGAAGGASGLTLVKTQTIGSGVSSVTVSDAFSSTYDNYKIIVSGGVASASATLTLQLGSTTSAYYYWGISGNSGSTTVSGIVGSNVSNFADFGTAGVNSLSADVEVSNAFLSKRTTVFSQAIRTTTAGTVKASWGFQDSDTSFTAFTIAIDGGNTMTGGTIKIYGYQNS
jgi:hypothetical protein